MSQENVEIARRIYPGPVDLAAMLADSEAAVREAIEPLVHRDFETVPDPGYQMLLGDPGQGAGNLTVFVGVDGFLDVFRDWLSGWQRWLVTPTNFIDANEGRVLVEIEITARSKEQQIAMTIQGGNLLTFDEDRLVRLELFFRRAEALEAAGLSE